MDLRALDHRYLPRTNSSPRGPRGDGVHLRESAPIAKDGGARRKVRIPNPFDTSLNLKTNIRCPKPYIMARMNIGELKNICMLFY